MSRLGNPDIKWETTESLNIGLDASFFNTRMVYSFEYYYTPTKAMLLASPMPIYMGFISSGETRSKAVSISTWE